MNCQGSIALLDSVASSHWESQHCQSKPPNKQTRLETCHMSMSDAWPQSKVQIIYQMIYNKGSQNHANWWFLLCIWRLLQIWEHDAAAIMVKGSLNNSLFLKHVWYLARKNEQLQQNPQKVRTPSRCGLDLEGFGKYCKKPFGNLRELAWRYIPLLPFFLQFTPRLLFFLSSQPIIFILIPTVSKKNSCICCIIPNNSPQRHFTWSLYQLLNPIDFPVSQVAMILTCAPALGGRKEFNQDRRQKLRKKMTGIKFSETSTHKKRWTATQKQFTRYDCHDGLVNKVIFHLSCQPWLSFLHFNSVFYMFLVRHQAWFLPTISLRARTHLPPASGERVLDMITSRQ